MTERELSTLIWLRVRDITTLLMHQKGVELRVAFNLVLGSEVFKLLADEKTKVWHYSVHMLFELLQSELTTGVIELPETQA